MTMEIGTIATTTQRLNLSAKGPMLWSKYNYISHFHFVTNCFDKILFCDFRLINIFCTWSRCFKYLVTLELCICLYSLKNKTKHAVHCRARTAVLGLLLDIGKKTSCFQAIYSTKGAVATCFH